MTETPYLTTDELAARLKTTNAHLRKLRVKGGGPPYLKLGGKDKSPVRYDVVAVDAWLTNHSTAPRERVLKHAHPGRKA